MADLTGGVIVESLAETFGDTATISVTTGGDAAALPAGASAVGEPVTVTSTEEPTIPVVVGLPIPDGADRENLFILRTTDDGTQQILGGFIEGDTYLTATPGFSDFQLVGHALEGALTLGTGTNEGVDLTPEGDTPPQPTPLRQQMAEEYRDLVLGTQAAPAQRSVTISGPGEVGIRPGSLSFSEGTAVYTATDFVAYDPRFATFEFTLFGDGLAFVGGGSTSSGILGSVPVVGVKEGRSLITVEATDPLTGVTAFASKRVFVVEDSLTIFAVANENLYFGGDDEGPQVGLEAFGGTAPYEWNWTWSDGLSDFHTGNRFRTSHPPISSDVSLTVTVVDANETEASATIALRGVPGSKFNSAALLSGPTTGRVGDELLFQVLLWSADFHWNPPPQVLLGGSSGTAVIEGEQIRVTFDEPGMGVILLMDNASSITIEDQVRLATAAVKITGEPPPAEARFGEVPAVTAAGTPAAFTVEARGGIVTAEGKLAPHTAHVDFGDGTAADLAIPTESALDWASAPVEHTWEEGGDYVVTLTITTPDGQTAEATTQVEVVSKQRAAGEFFMPEGDQFTIHANRVVLIIDGSSVEFKTFEYELDFQHTRFFIDGSGNEVSVPADCVRKTIRTFRKSDAELNLANSKFKGTITIRDKSDDIGGDCPFGGGHRNEIRTGKVRGTFIDGAVEMTLEFPAISGGGTEATLSITAEVL